MVSDKHPGLARLSEQAHDLDALRRSVDEAASIGSGVWLSYLFTVVYLSVATVGVTHRDLLLEGDVKLPFLNIDLPLFVFFLLSPFILIVAHHYALIYVLILASKLRSYNEELVVQAEADPTIAERLRGQLPSSILVQFIAGPLQFSNGFVGLTIRWMFWTTLVLAPILLLLTMQLIFLPYHSAMVTWAHRCAIVADILLIWLLWPAVLRARVMAVRSNASGSVAGAVACLLPMAMSLTCATMPGEWLDGACGGWRVIPPNPVAASFGQIGWTSLHSVLFDGPVDPATLRRRSLLSNTLVLPLFRGGRDPGGPSRSDAKLNLRGRELTGAILTGADLRGADLSEAVLTGADLSLSDLRGADMRQVTAPYVNLNAAKMQGATLAGAQLQAANLSHANLTQAILPFASLRSTNLDHASLQGSDLVRSSLTGAILWGAHLQAADLDGAEAFAADFNKADLQGASLVRAQLQGATFEGATLRGTSLWKALVWRADLDDVHVSDIDGRDVDWERHFVGGVLDQADRQFLQRPSEEWSALAYKGLYAQAKADARSVADRLTLPLLRQLDPDADYRKAGRVPDWRKAVESASVDPQARRKALAEVLVTTACANYPDAGSLISGATFARTVLELGDQAQATVAALLADDCPATALLEAPEKAKLKIMALRSFERAQEDGPGVVAGDAFAVGAHATNEH